MRRTRHYTPRERKPHRQSNPTHLTKHDGDWYQPFENYELTNNGNKRKRAYTSLGIPISAIRQAHAIEKVQQRRRERRRRNRGDFDVE